MHSYRTYRILSAPAYPHSYPGGSQVGRQPWAPKYVIYLQASTQNTLTFFFVKIVHLTGRENSLRKIKLSKWVEVSK